MRAPIAVLLTGVMLFASTGTNNIWPLGWLAPAPLLVVVTRLPPGRAALAALAAATIGALNLALAYRDLPPALIAGAVAMIAVPFSVLVLAWRTVARRGRPAVTVLAYASLSVSFEYLLSLVSPNGTFGSLAYSQADVPIVVQIASLTGITGITFVLSMVAAAIAVRWRHRGDTATVRAAVTCAAVPVVVMLAYGGARLLAGQSARTVTVGLAAADGVVEQFGDPREEVALPIVRDYARRVAALADRGARVVVLPEKFVTLTPDLDPRARAILASVARDKRITIVAGFNEATVPPRNIAVVFNSLGAATLEYAKMHLVPGLERGYQVGTTLGIVPGLAGPVGVAICKDLDFASLGRAYGRAGVGLLLVAAWDFVRDGWAHSRMAVVRGVEGGFAIARSATEGRLTASDATGRIIAERRSDEARDVLITARVPLGTGRTFYSRAGDWFPWVAILVALNCLLVRRWRQPVP